MKKPKITFKNGTWLCDGCGGVTPWLAWSNWNRNSPTHWRYSGIRI